MTLDAILRQAIRETIREELTAFRDDLKTAMQPAPKREEYLSTGEAAEVLGVHPETLRLMVRDGRLPRREIAGSFRFARTDLEILLRGNNLRAEAAEFATKAVHHGLTSRNH